MERTNEMSIEFDSRSCNEGFARVSVAAFCTQLNPTLEEVADVKTAVSEAITNAIIHGYENQVHKIRIECKAAGHELYLTVIDKGKGIADIKKPWSRCSPPGRNGTAPVWVLLLWKLLWMKWWWCRS